MEGLEEDGVLRFCAVFRTGRDGRETVRGLVVGEQFNLVFTSPELGNFPARRHGLVASADEIVIQLSVDELPTSSVVARLPVPMQDVEFVLVSTSGDGQDTESPDAVGELRFDDVIAGEYAIHLSVSGSPAGDELARFVVAAGTEHDAGMLVLPQRGRVVLELSCDDGLPTAIENVHMWNSNGVAIDGFEVTTQGFTSPHLHTGTYKLHVTPTNAAPFATSIEVDAQPLQHHRLVCSRGVTVAVEVVTKVEGAAIPQSLEVWLDEVDEDLGLRRVVTRPTDSTDFKFALQVAPGTYKIWFQSLDPTARGSFETVVAVTTEGAELRIALD